MQQASTIDEFPRLAMRTVSSIVHADFCSFDDVDPESGSTVAEVEPNRELFEGAFEVLHVCKASTPSSGTCRPPETVPP